MGLNTIKQALYNWAGNQSIWANQNAPRPKGPFQLLQLTSYLRVGDDIVGSMKSDGSYNISGTRELNVTVNAFGPNSFDRLSSLMASLQSPLTREKLRAAGLIFVSHSGISDLTGLVDTEYDERAMIEVLFRTSVGELEQGTWIETVDMHERYASETGLTFIENNYKIEV